MSYSLIRLTLYGLLSSLEADLRFLIRSQLLAQNSLEDLISDEVYQKILTRAAKDGISDPGSMIDFLDFGESFQILGSRKELLDQSIVQLLRDHAKDFERLAPVRNRVMHSRPLRFEDTTLTLQVTRALLKGFKAVFPLLSAMEMRLGANPDFALTLEFPRTNPETAKTTTNLPIPDFDETGFLGRQNEVASLTRALKGPYPVISVLGEGGVGKTALALQAAYEILDDPEQDYDSIVWTSSKMTRLTLNEVQRIEGAIEDSLGIFRSISKELGGENDNDHIKEILDYMNSFKILLILDNLETVLDENIRRFLYGLTGSSKVLITSRVGIGELNYTFPLRGMGQDEARQLIRATAQARRVMQLSQVSNDQLNSYCARMKNNPAFIKWFVTAVQCGRRPEEVFARPELFLDFCLSNVYKYLSPDAILIANALVAVPGRHTQPVLAYLTELDGDRFQTALRLLITTNMVTMGSLASDGSMETVYELGELPRLYLIRHHSPRPADIALFQNRKRAIGATHERLAAANLNDRYNPKTIDLRTRDDSVVAQYLIRALKSVATRDFDKALEEIERAKQLAPGYFEVYRVEGWALSNANNLPAARAAYEIAIELEAKSAPLYFWYGGFLLRYADDLEGAEAQFIKAIALDPDAPSLQAELGRCRMYLRKYDQADEAFQNACSNERASLRTRRIAYDGWLQTSIRLAESEFERGEYLSALRALKNLPDKLSSVHRDCIDERILETFQKGIYAAQRIQPTLYKLGLHEDGQRLTERLNNTLKDLKSQGWVTDSDLLDDRERQISTQNNELSGRVLSGVVHSLLIEKKYGFISLPDGLRIFFHASALDGLSISALKIGQELRFVVREDLETGRIQATNIVVISEPEPDLSFDKEYVGTVKLFNQNQQPFGFIIAENGSEYFFHRNQLDARCNPRDLTPGVRVSFRLGKNAKGVTAVEVMPLE